MARANKVPQITMKPLKIIFGKGLLIIALVLFSNLMHGQEAAPEPDKAKTEQAAPETYKAGDVFEGKDGERITLIKPKKLPLGYPGWKVKFAVNGTSRNIYVMEKYLKEQCKKVSSAE